MRCAHTKSHPLTQKNEKVRGGVPHRHDTPLPLNCHPLEGFWDVPEGAEWEPNFQFCITTPDIILNFDN